MLNPKSNNNLIKKFNRAFLIQGALIIITAILSVYFATIVIDEILIKSAIEEEADYYWSRYQQNKDAALPDTLNLTGYSDKAQINEIDRKLIKDQEGFHEYVDLNLVLHVSNLDNTRLYLVYNRGQVDSLAAFYGLFPLALVLIVLYLALWLTYQFSRRTISPVIKLAEQVNNIDFKSSDLSLLKEDSFNYQTDDDVRILQDAILHLGERLEAFISRERNFTRDASHELRSPLTVINIAADMLMTEQELSTPALKSVQRIKRAIHDMEELISAFLLLARESDQSLAHELVCLNDVIEEEIERSEILNQKKDIEIRFNPQHKLLTHASEKVLSVMIGNLMRNAVLYTDEGNVDISFDHNKVIISDSGQGMSQNEVKAVFEPYFRGGNKNAHGHGVGLTIVKRLSDRFNWPINIESIPQQGTTVVVEFPDFQLTDL
ncbi:MAG: HAMP domain-containing sensor histidine kinase [Gammaproteobacteria bacterium]|nr:HAMP domain-containing sensor histidine kinase [Gammaproteobacteria bacterium]